MFTVASDRKEREAVAQRLYSAYATYKPESALLQLLSEMPELQDRQPGDYRTARQFINDYIINYYPNEATIKASFVDRVLLKQGPSNISGFELPVGGSRVDLFKINGCSSAYEIKTDLDTFCRLEKQIADYAEVFENVYVIASKARWRNLLDYLPESCGIYSYWQMKNGSYVFKLQRAPQASQVLNPEKQLHVLSKQAISKEYGFDSCLSKEEMICRCLNQRTPNDINRFFKRSLKTKYENHWQYLKDHRDNICEIDYEWFFHNNLDPAIIY